MAKKIARGPALAKAQEGGKLITQMLNAFVRGKDEGSKRVRAAALVESLWHLANHAENEGTRLAAIREIMDRTDGKVAERKEIRSLKIEGVVFLPASGDCEATNAAPPTA
jgi:hypothetical protein